MNSDNTVIPLVSSNLKPGQPILAQYPKDQEWYRAEVMEWNETTQTAKVRYVDYGNVAEVSLSITRDIPEPLIISLPKQAIPCRLSGVEPQGGEEGGGWGEGGRALEKLEELALTDETGWVEVVRVCGGDGGMVEVRMGCPSCEDFSTVLVDSALAARSNS